MNDLIKWWSENATEVGSGVVVLVVALIAVARAAESLCAFALKAAMLTATKADDAFFAKASKFFEGVALKLDALRRGTEWLWKGGKK